MSAAFLGIVMLGMIADIALDYVIGPPAARWLLGRAVPWEGAVVSVRGTRLDGLHRLAVSGLTVRLDGSDDAVATDSVVVDFSLPDLIRSPLRLRRLFIGGLGVHATRSDEGWRLLQWPGATGDAAPTGPLLVVDRLELDGASLSAVGALGDTVLAAERAGAEATAIALGGDPALELRQAELDVDAPGRTPGWLAIVARGTLGDGRWTIGEVVLTDSTGGGLTIRGSVGAGGASGTGLDLTFEGDDVPLASIPGLGRLVVAGASARLEGTLVGTTESAEVTARIVPDSAGSMHLEGTIRQAAGTLALDLTATLDELDVGVLLDGGAPVGPANGTVVARLERADAGRPAGTLDVDLRTTEEGPPVTVRGTAQLLADTVRLDLSGSRDPVALEVRGDVRPYEDQPEYGVDVGVSVGAAPVESGTQPAWRRRWRADLRVEGRGLSAATAEATTRGSVRSSGPSAADAIEGTVRGLVRGGTASADARFHAGEGVLEAAADAPLDDPVGGWRLGRIEWRGLPAWVWTTSDWAGRSWGGAELSAGGGGMRGTVRLDSVAGGRADGAHGRLALRLAGGALTVSGTASVRGASASVEDLTVRDGRLRRADLSFAGVDLTDLLTPAAPSAVLSGTLALGPASAAPSAGASGRGGGPATERGRPALDPTALVGEIRLEKATLAGEPLEGGGDLVLGADGVEAQLELVSDGQRLRLDGLGAVDSTGAVVTVRRIDLTGIDPALWMGPRLPAGSLTGRIGGAWRGADAATATAEATLALDSARVGPATLDSVTVTAELEGGRLRLRSSTSLLGRTVAMEGEVSEWNPWAATATAIVRSRDAEAPGDSLDLLVDFGPESARTSSAGDPGTITLVPLPTASAVRRLVIRGGGRIGDLVIDSISLASQFDDGAVVVERLHVGAPSLLLDGAGVLPIAASSTMAATLALEARSSQVEALLGSSDSVGTSAEVTVRSSGRWPTLEHVLDVEAADLRSAGLTADSLRVHAVVRSDSSSSIANVEGTAMVGGPSGLSFGAEEFALLRLGNRDVGQRLSASAAWSASEAQAVRITEAELALDSLDRWRAERPARVSWDDGLAFQELALRSPSGSSLRVSGRMGRTGPQGLELVADSVPFRLVGSEGALLRRSLSGSVIVGGTSTEPTVRATATMVGVDDPSSGAGSPTATLEATADTSGLRIRAESRPDGVRSVELRGFVPRRPSFAEGTALLTPVSAPVDLTIRVVAAELADLAQVAGAGVLDRVTGRVDVDATLQGPEDDTRLAGQAVATGVAGRAVAFGTRFDADRIALTLSGSEARIQSATVTDGGRGRARLSGSVDFRDLSAPRFDVEADFERFRAADSQQLRATVNGPLRLGGTVASPTLTGSLHVVDGTYRMSTGDVSGRLEEVELTAADYEELERRFGVRTTGDDRVAFFDAIKLDLGLTATSNVWARRTSDPGVDAEMAGSVRVLKEPRGELRLEGRLNVIQGRSTVAQFGRRFDLTRAQIGFNGPLAETTLDARALYEVADVDIWIDADLGDSGLSLVLGSDPVMSQNDIVSYLASGRRATDVERFGEGDANAASVGTEVALGLVTAEVEALARSGLGLDVVQIQQDGIYGLTLVAGRFVTPRLFVGVQQPVAFDAASDTRRGLDRTELTAEYRIKPWLLTNMTGARSLFRIFLAVERGR